MTFQTRSKTKGAKLLRFSSTMDCAAGGEVSFVEPNQAFFTAPDRFLDILKRKVVGILFRGPTNSSEGCGDSGTGWLVPDIFVWVDLRTACYFYFVRLKQIARKSKKV